MADVGTAQRLGFTEAEEALSLAILRAAAVEYSDVPLIAMDLARYATVPLEEATVALVFANAGAYTRLRRLGFDVHPDARPRDAILAVAQEVDGQAGAYAKTWDGSKLVRQQLVGGIGQSLSSLWQGVVRRFRS